MVREIRGYNQPFKAPLALISGGECTVTVRGTGRGGRCVEFLASLAVELDGMEGIHALAADTDGIDGTEDNAGALLGPDTKARAEALGLNARKMLANNDCYSYFAALGDLVITGPTLTNVNDYRVILVL
jgi:hydroxypyruvate reductase